MIYITEEMSKYLIITCADMDNDVMLSRSDRGFNDIFSIFVTRYKAKSLQFIKFVFVCKLYPFNIIIGL